MAEPSKLRILVADDDADILNLATFILTHSGYEVVGVADGSAAIAAIESVVAAGFAAGANEFIKKPVNLHELMSIVNSFLARNENE